MKTPTARQECMRILKRLIGAECIPQFLRTPQPALEDRTGAHLLKHSPKALLDRLRELEAEMKGGIDDE
jgi:hypothetical protein